jgi:hypothetical protein
MIPLIILEIVLGIGICKVTLSKTNSWFFEVGGIKFLKSAIRRNKLKLELRTGGEKRLSIYGSTCARRAKNSLTTEHTEDTEKS